MLVKKLKKSIALILTSVMIGMPVMNTAYALEEGEATTEPTPVEDTTTSILEPTTISELGQKTIDEITPEEGLQVIEELKADFHKKYGYSDEFIVASQDESNKVEVNGATGLIRITLYDTTGAVKETSELNYLDGLDIVKREELQQTTLPLMINVKASETTVLRRITTGGPDSLSLYVGSNGAYNSKYRLVATGLMGGSKTYYKNDYWNTGNTEGLYTNITQAQGNISSIRNAAIVISAYYQAKAVVSAKLGKPVPDPAILAPLLDISGFSISTIALANLCATYLKNVGEAQFFYSKL